MFICFLFAGFISGVLHAAASRCVLSREFFFYPFILVFLFSFCFLVIIVCIELLLSLFPCLPTSL